MRHREKEIRALQRKTAPFLQMTNDRRFIAFNDREDLIKDGVFADRTPEWRKIFDKIYLMEHPW